MTPQTVTRIDRRCTLASDRLDDLRRRLDATRLPPDLGSTWDRGVPAGWLSDLLAEWRGFDAGRLQRRLDGFEHRWFDVDGQVLHLVHVPGAGPDPLPLVLAHGWPSSILEYLDVAAALSDPAGHGGDPADAFTVIVPSLPGFGFSAPPPPGGLAARQVALLWHAAISEGLGYGRYVAHGGDLGAGVTAWLARDQPASVAAIHLATPGLAPASAASAAEAQFATAVAAWTAAEGGYAHEHATKPATLGAALADSPSGLAAWIAEKIVAWSSTGADGGPAFSRELLLSTLTLYWATETITTSLLPYWAHRHSPAAALPVDDPSPVPASVTIFGGERVPFPKPPRELVERYVTLAAWAEHQTGGHFPSVAEPELFLATLRDAFRGARGAGGRGAG